MGHTLPAAASRSYSPACRAPTPVRLNHPTPCAAPFLDTVLNTQDKLDYVLDRIPAGESLMGVQEA